MSNIPCLTCPWRKESKVGGSDIPGFDIELMRGLRNTVGEGDGFRPVMACHGSKIGKETSCVGYLAREGYSNLFVRLLASRGQINMPAIIESCSSLDLWNSFNEMLAAYEAAQD